MTRQHASTVVFLFANWKTSDSIWKEQAKWNPGCLYVSYVKGVEFILNNAGVVEGF